MQTQFRKIVHNRKQEMAQDLIAFCNISAINPKMGGTGEYTRMKWIEAYLSNHQIPFQTIAVPDPRVPQGERLNIVVNRPGTQDNTLWLVGHCDTVNADPTLWDTDPFVAQQIDNRIYGLGAEDDGQAVVAMLHCCRILWDLGWQGTAGVGFLFVSDEETGSHFGIAPLVETGILSADDEALVPDGGSVDGSFIQIAEKSQLWLEFSVKGQQTHGATPHKGCNAHSIGMRLGVALEDGLRKEYPQQNSLFSPATSTFELTQVTAPITGPNVISPDFSFVMDIRLLPEISVDEVLCTVNEICNNLQTTYHCAKIKYTCLNRSDAPAPTLRHSTIVQCLSQCLQQEGIVPRLGGIGGSTCAAVLRRAGLQVAVWATMHNLAHQPNEFAQIEHLEQDTYLFLSTIASYTCEGDKAST